MKEREAWFAIQVQALKEKTVARALEGKGFECFLPLRRSAPREDRNVTRVYALFPGYVFCRLDYFDRSALVITTPGVMRLLGRPYAPEPIPDHEIEALQKVVASPLHYEPAELMVGERVRIIRGPLRDLEGTLCMVRSQHRLLVEVTLLQRAVSVEVSAASVRSLDERPSRWRLQGLTLNDESANPAPDVLWSAR